MKLLKQVAGIDVSQNELEVSLGKICEDLSHDLFAHKIFKNTIPGIKSLIKWVNSNSKSKIPVYYVMEATGVYHQKLAYNLADKDYIVSIVLPNKMSNYMRTLNIKTITDKTASQAITQFGLERKLDRWKRPKKIYKELQQLGRERDQIVHERVIVKNQLHAENAEAEPKTRSVKRLKARIKFLNSQEKEIKKDIELLIKNGDNDLQEEIKLICSIPGVSTITATTVLAETNGFELVKNKKQLTSYAGLDVKEKRSGTSIKGKPKISKQGNTYLRKAMHFPSLSAVKYNKHHKELYVRLVAKSGNKMKALVAVQRKVLELIYVIYKSKKPYDENYIEIKRA